MTTLRARVAAPTAPAPRRAAGALPATLQPAAEHEFEAAPGLPEPLPADERLLWQGSPHWPTLAREAFHLRKTGLYFGLLLAWRLAELLAAATPTLSLLKLMAPPVLLAGLGLGVVALMAWLSARSTVYTLTSRRVVMRVGIVLTVTFNLPHARIAAAGLRRGRRGHGDIALQLAGTDRIAWLHLWPHVRPWQLRRAQPMLRALPRVAEVAALLVQAQQALAVDAPAQPKPRPTLPEQAAPAAQPGAFGQLV
ncbi:photosynthetic complex putative assembly protein PuhB [Aquincola tertiaricarbonis]|uniref:photosynthetic complex putative assembly protein PuhB n=1 Tax=Aquincola tertiaricarbonis TaxID=391953 RepID=UPI000A859692|nr:photosynthetic complex putative assembly protein PuhB [Aquincola tertiaricarbonis]